jgi:hypothetical protein
MNIAALSSLDVGLLIGTWHNTNPRARFIKNVVITEKEGTLFLSVSGMGEMAPKQWGETVISAFTESRESKSAAAFLARFDSPAVRSTLQAYVVKGVLVIVGMTQSKHGDEGANIFTKEFFYRTA